MLGLYPLDEAQVFKRAEVGKELVISERYVWAQTRVPVWYEQQGQPQPHVARILFFSKLPGSSPGDAPGTRTVRLAVCELWL